MNKFLVALSMFFSSVALAGDWRFVGSERVEYSWEKARVENGVRLEYDFHHHWKLFYTPSVLFRGEGFNVGPEFRVGLLDKEYMLLLKSELRIFED